MRRCYCKIFVKQKCLFLENTLYQKPQNIFQVLKKMTTSSQPEHNPNSETKQEPILCNHCLRTATNGVKCRGICVADSGY